MQCAYTIKFYTIEENSHFINLWFWSGSESSHGQLLHQGVIELDSAGGDRG